MHISFHEGEYQISSRESMEVKLRTESLIHKASKFVGKFLCPADIANWRLKSDSDFIPGVVTLRCMTKSEYGLNFPEQFRKTYIPKQSNGRKKRDELPKVIDMELPKKIGLNIPPICNF